MLFLCKLEIEYELHSWDWIANGVSNLIIKPLRLLLKLIVVADINMPIIY
ncbi:hypothetical protein [Polaribacter sp. L3A8]|nr:hypothetical protein [Polaribacter sp. L3A8]